MKHIDDILKFHRVNRPKGVCAMVLDHFKDSWSLPSPRLSIWVLSAKLCNAESGSYFIDNRLGESQQVFLARSNPVQRLLAWDPLRSRHGIIPVLGYWVKGSNSLNILVDKHFRDPLSKDAGNLECQLQVGVKSAVFNGVYGLPCYAHLSGERCLGPFPFRAKHPYPGFE
jgi:hypothetical protein